MMVVEPVDCYKFLLIESEQENQNLSAKLCWFWRHNNKRILKTGPGARREGVVKQSLAGADNVLSEKQPLRVEPQLSNFCQS